VRTHRCEYTCEEAPVNEYLLGELKEKTSYFLLFFSARAAAGAAAPAAV
jgi:hypothetical protein